MIKLTIALAAIGTAQMAQADYKSIHVAENGAIMVEASVSTSNEFGRRLFDALSKSPELKEVNNAYVEPGEMFESNSRKLIVRKERHGERAHLTLNLQPGEASAHMSGSTLRISFKSGTSAGAELHRALLNSASPNVITAKKPGKKITVYDDHAVVLSQDVYIGNYLTCSTAFNSTRAYCDIVIVE
jgi:hypothetical protein